jgi:hypothetical protein
LGRAGEAPLYTTGSGYLKQPDKQEKSFHRPLLPASRGVWNKATLLARTMRGGRAETTIIVEREHEPLLILDQ